MHPRTPLTHFLALPLYNVSSMAALTTSVSNFTEETALSSAEPEIESHGATADSKGSVQLPPGCIRPPSTLHLTLGVMSLTTPEKVDVAASMLKGMDMQSLLESAASSSTDPRVSTAARSVTTAAQTREGFQPLRIQLKGLSPMHDASATTVLYVTPCDGTGRLRPLCEALRAKFTEWRVLVPEKRELKLHATIVNTIYAKGQPRGRRGGKERFKIDARELVERWRDHLWAEVLVDKVVICEMGAKEDEEGVLRYREVAEAPLV